MVFRDGKAFWLILPPSFSGITAGSPVLLRNISATESLPPSPSAHGLVCLIPGPFGSHQPAIPTASAIVIARVASPVTLTRAHYAACMKGLSAYFGRAIRLVKQGDIIAIPVDTTFLHRTQDDMDKADARQIDIPEPG